LLTVVEFGMASLRVLLVLWAACGLAAAKGAAHRTRRYVLREVRVEGNASDAEKKLLNDRIWSSLELILSEERDEIAHAEDVAAVLAAHPNLKSGYDARVGVELGDLLKADKVLAFSVTRSGPPDKGDWLVRVWGVDVRAFKVGASVEVPCRSCTADEVLGDLSHSLGPALQVEGGSLCTVKVTSRPDGAVVSLDGVAVGETPFSHSVLPGKHGVAVEKQGFSRGEDELECPAGAAQNMSFALTAGGGAVVHQEQLVAHRSPALKIVGGALIVLGAAGLAAGAADLYLDGRGSCNLAPGQTQCPTVYDTKLSGGVLVGVGIAALVGGVVTLVVDAVRGSSPAKASGSASLMPTLSGAGLQGSF
jgi:PEGA domain